MSHYESRGARSALALLAVVALGGALAYSHQARAKDEDHEGRVVNISPNGGDSDLEHKQAAVNDQTSVALKYWLGLQGAPLDSAVLRTHLQLADDVGVVVENVVDDSPAAKAGLQRHDVLIAVNGEQITDMQMLQRTVAASEGKPVELKIIRLAKEETISVTPEERPADLRLATPEGGEAFPGIHGNMPMGDLQRMLQQMQQGGVRVFGPGMVMNDQQMGMMQFPGGVEVKITREGNGPATVTVTRNGELWTVKGDDKEALAKLPDDLRPAVEQLLRGQQVGDAGALNMPNLPGMGDLPALPRQMRLFNFENRGGGGDVNQQLLDRMQQLEKQLQQLEQRLSEEHSAVGTNSATDPSNH